MVGQIWLTLHFSVERCVHYETEYPSASTPYSTPLCAVQPLPTHHPLPLSLSLREEFLVWDSSTDTSLGSRDETVDLSKGCVLT